MFCSVLFVITCVGVCELFLILSTMANCFSFFLHLLLILHVTTKGFFILFLCSGELFFIMFIFISYFVYINKVDLKRENHKELEKKTPCFVWVISKFSVLDL